MAKFKARIWATWIHKWNNFSFGVFQRFPHSRIVHLWGTFWLVCNLTFFAFCETRLIYSCPAQIRETTWPVRRHTETQHRPLSQLYQSGQEAIRQEDQLLTWQLSDLLPKFLVKAFNFLILFFCTDDINQLKLWRKRCCLTVLFLINWGNKLLLRLKVSSFFMCGDTNNPLCLVCCFKNSPRTLRVTA